VIELSGARTATILEAVFRPRNSHRHAGQDALQLGHLVAGAEPIDEVVVRRRGRHAEINLHGGPEAARAALALLQAQGAALAPPTEGPGESFDPAHPRWDNPAIGTEMLEALPLARSTLAAAAVTHQWSGGLSQLARTILSGQTCGDGRGVRDAAAECLSAAAGLATMERLLHPAEVVLAGPPNAGKSTLANVLVGRQVSIVHTRPGTTRDWVRELALLDGVPIWLTDTAGLWDVSEGIDAEAVRRAHARAGQAQLVLLLSAGTKADLPAWWQADNVIRIAGKCDVLSPARDAICAVSAVTGQGMDELRKAIRAALGLDGVNPAAPMAFTQRQAALLDQAGGALQHHQRHGAAEALRRLLRRRPAAQ